MGVVIYVMKIRLENIQRKTACQRQTSEFVSINYINQKN